MKLPSLSRLAAALATLLLTTACATSGGVAHTAPEESKPHISWEIRTGGEYGDRTAVCRSGNQTATCALRTGDPVMLRVFLHAASGQTNYLGAWRAPFLKGWTLAHYRDVAGSVKAGEDAYRVSVGGIVTDKPGQYGFNIRLDAAMIGRSEPTTHRIVVDVPVTVTGDAKQDLAFRPLER